MGKNKAGWGGKRTGSGRKRATVRKATVKKQSPLRLRQLLGVESAEFQGNPRAGGLAMRNPRAFLTCLSFLFVAIRVMMQKFRDTAIDWSCVSLSFGVADARNQYGRALAAMGVSRNGSKKLSISKDKLKTLPEKCRVHLGTYATFAEVMFCSQIHDVDPALSDSLTAAMANWMLAVMGSEEQRLTYFHFVTLYCFGHLRQSNAIKLLTPDCAGYLGFSVLSSPAQLAEFIAAQDKIQWTQQVTQELSKLPGKNSFKAAVGTASVYELLGDDEWWRHLNEATSYQDACNKLQTLPSNGPFISKNVLAVVLNGIVFPQVSRAKLPLWLCVVLDDFLVEPTAVFGPGPTTLSERFFGHDWSMSDFEAVRKSLNHLLGAATVTYNAADITLPHRLTGPQLQGVWCQLKDTSDDYSNASLSHACLTNTSEGA